MTRRHTDMTFAPPDMADMAVLYQQYAPALFAYLTQHMPHEEDAEDILVEVFLAALESAQFSEMPEKAQLAWLWRVARNKTIDVYRRSTRRGHSVTVESITESVPADDDAGPEHSAPLREEYDVLQGHLKGLSPLQQEVLQLRFSRDMRCSEIAAHLGKREGAIKVMLSRTLNLLRNIYKA